MADSTAVRDAILRRQNERHTDALRAERDAARLEIAIENQRRKIEKLEDKLDHETMVLQALEAKRNREANGHG